MNTFESFDQIQNWNNLAILLVLKASEYTRCIHGRRYDDYLVVSLLFADFGTVKHISIEIIVTQTFCNVLKQSLSLSDIQNKNCCNVKKIFDCLFIKPMYNFKAKYESIVFLVITSSFITIKNDQ